MQKRLSMTCNHHRRQTFCGLFLAIPTLLYSQSANTDTLHTLSELEVTNTRIYRNASSNTPTQRLTATDMTHLGATDVGDALKHLTGIQVKDYGGIGGIKTVHVRGLGAQHTGVLYDGVQIGDCQNGQVDLGRFTLNGISAVTLTIGQANSIFQSAKTFASAASVEILSDADQQFAKQMEGTVGMKVGAYGLINPSLKLRQQFNKLILSAYADYQRADGSYDFKLANGQNTIHEKRRNSDVESWRGELNAVYRPTTNQSLRFKLYGYDSHRGLPGAVIYDNPYSAERLTDKNVFTQLAYENRFSDRLKMKAAAKWNYSWMRDYDVKAAGETTDTYRQNETYLAATLWANILQGWDVSISQDFAHNYLSMSMDNSVSPARNSWWTSFATQYSIGRFNLTGSLLSTQISEQVSGGTAGDGFHRLSPTLSLQYRLTQQLRIRGGYQDIFRTPTLNDLYYTGIGRRTLRPEKTRQWNLGATWQQSWQGVMRHLTITLDSYHGRITDKIVAVPRMFMWQMSNVGKVLTWGLDATIESSLNFSEEWQLDAKANYSYLHAKDKTDQRDVFYGHQIAYTPEHSGGGSVILHTPWVDFTYQLMATGVRYSLGYNIPDNRMKAFTDHSIGLSRSVLIGNQRLDLQLDIKNLGGRNYEIVRFYPMPGRNVTFSALWSL